MDIIRPWSVEMNGIRNKVIVCNPPPKIFAWYKALNWTNTPKHSEHFFEAKGQKDNTDYS